MKIDYLCTHWGSENMPAGTFLESVCMEGYNGVEVNLPGDKAFTDEFMEALDKIRQTTPGFIFAGQCVPNSGNETVEVHIGHVLKRLEYLAGFSPDFINSHTGKDFYSFDDNCRVIEAVEDFAANAGISVLHETHRGRFSFHGPSLLPYIERFPQIRIVADYSHWCNVSESLLEGQEHILQKVMPNVAHIHARIGHAQGPQVNDPFAPEWAGHLDVFTEWWKDILDHKAGQGMKGFTITPEFGPAPYMPAMPFTCEPLCGQWEANVKLKDHLKASLGY